MGNNLAGYNVVLGNCKKNVEESLDSIEEEVQKNIFFYKTFKDNSSACPLKSCGTYYGHSGPVEIILIIEDLWKCSINEMEGLLLFYQCKHVKELQKDKRGMEESFLSIPI